LAVACAPAARARNHRKPRGVKYGVQLIKVWCPPNWDVLDALHDDALEMTGDGAYLCLQPSSHSNYPAREVFFDDVIFNAEDNGE